MSFEYADAKGVTYEWVAAEASGRRGGYWRKVSKNHTIPSAAQAEHRLKFTETALSTKGLTGTVKLPDGREVSRSAIFLGNQLGSPKIELPPTTEFEEGRKQTEPYDVVRFSNHPSKTVLKPVPGNNSTMSSLHDIYEALRISRMVENGQMSRELGILLLLEKMSK